MALHAGEAEERGGDYLGPTLNRIARLLSAGRGGQTLLSLATRTLVGCEGAVEEVRECLRREKVCLLTLTGPCGTGKPRLSLQASAAELLDEYRDGVFFVGLAPLNAPTLVATTIPRTFGLTEAAEQSIEENLKEYVRYTEPLLVLDSFERSARAA